uniref:Uncharacterized protein n=1 Tax=Nelumbo nucifera TaxID=4432 RepID=A0A822YDJ8_NELNU|nr:TPA_asm: hypothetical protein HUJ06_011075 [Nelumbo nucifera]
MASKSCLTFGILLVVILLFSFEVVAREMAEYRHERLLLAHCAYEWECGINKPPGGPLK